MAALGGLLFGYDWVVIGGAKPFYEPFFGISGDALLQGLTMSSALLGCVAGAVATCVAGDRFGRRQLLVVSAALFTVSALGTAFAPELISFNLARWLGGVGIGIASSASPMYISEVSPAAIRGRLVSLNQLTIVIGILAAQIANWLIAEPVPAGASLSLLAESWNGQLGWRWMFGVEAVPAGLFLILSLTVPESPRWLLARGHGDAARRVLERLGGQAHAVRELAAIVEALSRDVAEKARRRDLFLEPGLRRVIGMGALLAVLQQWCGINVIFNYAQEVFAAAGHDVSEVLFSIVITGIVNLVFTLVAMAAVDRAGRRALMLLGCGGLAVIYAFLGAGFALESRGIHMLALVIAAIACYALTLAPVTWVVIAEIFPNRVRGAAMSIAVFSLWSACTALTFTFPYLHRALGAAGTFWLYGAICVAGFVYVALRLPETRGRSLEQIEKELFAERPGP